MLENLSVSNIAISYHWSLKNPVVVYMVHRSLFMCLTLLFVAASDSYICTFVFCLD